MLRFIVSYGGPITLAVAPLITTRYSLLDLFGYAPNTTTDLLTIGWAPFFTLEGSKPEVELQLRATLTLVGVALIVIGGYFDAYAPSRSLASFRSAYLANTVKNQWRKTGRVRSTLRINVMYLSWRWYLPFGQSFKVIWKDKFEPSDRDGHVRLYKWQGVCGKAARRREAEFVDFRNTPVVGKTFASQYLLQNQFHLCSWQLHKTRHLKAILSVPMYEERGQKGQESYRCVGVINVDAKTDKDANYLSKKADDLALFLAQHGQLIAKMR